MNLILTSSSQVFMTHMRASFIAVSSAANINAISILALCRMFNSAQCTSSSKKKHRLFDEVESLASSSKKIRRVDVKTAAKYKSRQIITRNSSGDEIANVNFLCDDIVHYTH